MAETALVWFRNDLGLTDNPGSGGRAGLRPAGRSAIHIDPTDPELRPRGSASRWWLHHSLNALRPRLGRPGHPARDAYEGRAGPWRGHPHPQVQIGPLEPPLRPGGTRPRCEHQGRPHRTTASTAESHAGDALVEPFAIETATGTPYAVFTPFWKSLPQARHRRPSTERRVRHRRAARASRRQIALTGLRLGRRSSSSYWKIGEAAARQPAWQTFSTTDSRATPEGRDYPCPRRHLDASRPPGLRRNQPAPDLARRRGARPARTRQRRRPSQKFLIANWPGATSTYTSCTTGRHRHRADAGEVPHV